MNEINQVVEIVFNGIVSVIAIVGLLYGAWSLFEGFTGDQPESKRRGFFVIVATVAIVGMILLLKPILTGMIVVEDAPIETAKKALSFVKHFGQV